MNKIRIVFQKLLSIEILERTISCTIYYLVSNYLMPNLRQKINVCMGEKNVGWKKIDHSISNNF